MAENQEIVQEILQEPFEPGMVESSQPFPIEQRIVSGPGPIEQKIVGFNMKNYSKFFCPGTKGGQCNYVNGKCEVCGKDSAKPKDKSSVGEFPVEQQLISGPGPIEQKISGGFNMKDYSKFYCPRTKGGKCKYVNGKCKL
eukprot:CAMPEP_0184489320 /NCGR_PEP_ID=MMETSP0113_2-20130426/15063_1 /TAXON_ID=91329 /ORGANISM="Norrisiella sphaerica, Strain BC52" /LENGTH=139 /DNA_ID=CAMNT_0026872663 /DNA_START=73 /DNA_END=489 /DNA_ORIENTATION=-